jgi:hypothetical protein
MKTNTEQAVAKRGETKVARPLRVLVPLIRADIRDGEEAGVPYFIDAGEKLLEAKPQVEHGEWAIWVRKNFNRDPETVSVWMRLAKKKSRARTTFRQPRTLSEFTNPKRDRGHRPKWHAPVREAIREAHPNLTARPSTQVEDEREVERKLAYQLIDIGYRVLATKLHPDKGGRNGDGMQRLNKVRVNLKGLVANAW